MKPRALLIFPTIALMLSVSVGIASQPGEASLDKDARRAVVELAAEIIEQAYVDPQKAHVLADKLRQRGPGYDQRDPVALAKAVSHDLFLLSDDRHLKLKFNPTRFNATTAPDTPEGNALLEDYVDTVSTFDNFGFERVEVLSGNIGYFKLTHFRSGDAAFARADAAFAFLASSDALIIDLRGNRGGDSAMVRYLQGYFVLSPILAMRYQDRGEAELAETYSLVPAGSVRPGLPLYVLIDGQTASAAEDFAYSAQAFGRGLVMGEKSAGAANTITQYAIEPGFILSVSTGSPVHPVTGSNWGGAGVVPDIESPAEGALVRAQVEALTRLRDSAEDATLAARYGWALTPLLAQVSPPVLGQQKLLRLTGSYDAGWVSFKDGSLVFTPPSGVPTILHPLTSDTFALEGHEAYRLRFDRAQSDVTLVRIYPDGRHERFPRLHR